MKRGLVFIFLIFPLLFLSALSPLAEYRVKTGINWAEGVLDVVISRDIDISREYRPDLRFQGEQKIEDDFFSLFYNLILDLEVDSYYTAGDLLQNNRELNQRLVEVIGNRKKGLSRILGEWKELQVPYSCALYGDKGLLSIFVNHQYPDPLTPRLGFVPDRPYSGLVIYVKGKYALMNEQGTAALVPVFFPDFYDEEMNLIFSRENCDPEAIKKWGMVTYTENENLDAFAPRIGSFPLKTIALGLFGEYHADIVLSRKVADRLLSLQANRTLLKEGRILIICDLNS